MPGASFFLQPEKNPIGFFLAKENCFPIFLWKKEAAV